MPLDELHLAASAVQTNVSAPILAPLPLKFGPASGAVFSDTPAQIPRKVPPRRIALSGGGVRTIAHCGALEAWRDAGVLGCVEEYCGVSGGAFVALILCLGYTLEELKRLCLEFDFNLLNTFDPEQAFLFLETLGLDTGHALERLLVSILKHKGLQASSTFSELSDENPRLRVYATNLTKSCIQEFSKQKTPQAQILFAVRSSMSLPLYYTPMRESSTGHTYVDGGVLHNLPIAFLTAEEAHDTWGIMFSPSDKTKTDPSASVVDYMKHLYDSMLQMRYEGLLRPYNHQILKIPLSHISPIHFAMDIHEKKEMISVSYDKAREFLFQPSSWKPVRRNSVS